MKQEFSPYFVIYMDLSLGLRGYCINYFQSLELGAECGWSLKTFILA